MPFPRPTLSDLRAQVAADIAAGLPGSDALLRYSNLGITGDALAALAYLHYGYLDWIAQQAAPYTATDEYLEAWGALKKIYRKPASAASGTVTFSGTPGALISAGASVVRGDGETYTVQTSAAVAANGSVTVTVTDTNAGASGNTAAGSLMTLATAITGIQSTGAAAATFTGGADQEGNDDFRARVLAAFQAAPQGGAQPDYVEWAGEVPGVTRAWVAPNGFGAGTVVLYVMFDNAEAAYGGFPQGSNGVSAFDPGPGGKPRAVVATGDQLIVANALVTLQPVTALLFVCAAINNPINFTISGLATSSAATRAAIAAAVSDVFYRTAVPTGGTVNIDDIESAVGAVSGTEGFVIQTPSANIVSAVGYLPTLGTITYV
jgi:uncharacterized phage protein gp47/JayE